MTTATLLETSPRAADWRHIFGRLTDIPLRGPFAIQMDLPGHPKASAYLLDVSLISSEERLRLVNHIAARFNLDRAEVERDLDAQGVPILAEDVAVYIPQGLALSMMPDWDDDLDDDEDEDSWDPAERYYQDDDDDDF